MPRETTILVGLRLPLDLMEKVELESKKLSLKKSHVIKMILSNYFNKVEVKQTQLEGV